MMNRFQLRYSLIFLVIFFVLTGCGDEASRAWFKKFTGLNGRSIGTFSRTLYILAFEEDFNDSQSEAYNGSGSLIGRFPYSFLDDLCLQGSGIGSDGTVISIHWGTCDGGVFNSDWCTDRCFAVMDPTTHPYGEGASGESPIPFRSVAVDTSVIAMHTRLYLPAWDGFILPNGKRHDGCFAAKDTGGAIKGKRLDLHAGVGRKVYEMVAGQLGGKTDEEVFTGNPKCEGELRELIPKNFFLGAYEPDFDQNDYRVDPDEGSPEQDKPASSHENQDYSDDEPVGTGGCGMIDRAGSGRKNLSLATCLWLFFLLFCFARFRGRSIHDDEPGSP